jgi:hypothetical protein
LLESGDLTAARRSLTDSLAWARETDDLAARIFLVADLELCTGDLASSARHPREAIATSLRAGAVTRLPRLDLLGHLCAARGQWAEAVTIWGVFQLEINAEGALDLPLHAQRQEEPMRQAARPLARNVPGPPQQRGATMSLPPSPSSPAARQRTRTRTRPDQISGPDPAERT